MSDGRLLARNSAFNLIGWLLPLAVAVIAIPPLVRGLGAERFGILTLAWGAIGYFGLFELGLSRALTHAVAHRLGNGKQQEIPALTWTALLLLLALGVLGALVVAAITPTILTRVLNVPPQLQAEAILSFYVLAASLPFVVSGVGLRALMEAHQHFGAVNALRIPLITFMFVGPLLVLPFSRSLVPAVAMLALGRCLGWAGHLAVCLRRYAYLRRGLVIRWAAVGPLLRYGGWSTVSNVVSPAMTFLDRFLIGALLPLAAVTHYVTPYELVIKLLVIPGAILDATFPAFAATFASNPDRMAQLYDRTMRAIVLSMFPVILVMIALAHEGLRLWVGPVLPAESTIVLQWLAVGVFINAIAQSPFVALQGAGRPDAIAKLHLVELPLYAVGIWLLARSLGLTGVAIAWTLRVTLDAFVLLFIARRTLRLPLMPRTIGFGPLVLMLAAFAGAAFLEGTLLKLVYVATIVTGFVVTVGRGLLPPAEREALRVWLRQPKAQAAGVPAGPGAAATSTTEGLA